MSTQPSQATATLSPAIPTPNSPDRMHKLGLGALLFAHMTVDMQTSSLTVFLPLLLASFNLNYDQWRICFKWGQGRAREVEIVDYHS